MHHIYIYVYASRWHFNVSARFTSSLLIPHFFTPFASISLSHSLSLSFIRSLSLSLSLFQIRFLSLTYSLVLFFFFFFFLFIHLLLLDSLHSSSFPHTNWYYSLVTTLFLLFPLFTSIIFPLFSRFILPSCSVYRSTLVRAQLLKRRRRAIFHFSISWFVPSSFFFVSTLLTVIQRRSNTFEKVLLPKKKKKKTEEKKHRRNEICKILLSCSTFFFFFILIFILIRYLETGQFLFVLRGTCSWSILFHFIIQGMTNVCGNNLLREESSVERNVMQRNERVARSCFRIEQGIIDRSMYITLIKFRWALSTKRRLKLS